MIAEKLFTPKCLHTDRDVVFREDLESFFNYFFMKIKQETQNQNYIEEENLIEIINYKLFKSTWRDKKMTMLHFSKSKEENFKEFYEVLFGEVQIYITDEFLQNRNYPNIFKIISIFTLYSLYYTQTTDLKYQINTIPEILLEINSFIKTLKYKFSNKKIVNVILIMMNKLYRDDAFSIGTIIGLKTIILNKYGLPMEQKQKVYKEYSDINESLKILNKNKIDKKGKILTYKENAEDYFNTKRETVNLIKDLEDEEMKRIYSDFINIRVYGNQNIEKDNLYNLSHNFELLNLSKKDFKKNEITNLDLQFNQLDNTCNTIFK